MILRKTMVQFLVVLLSCWEQVSTSQLFHTYVVWPHNFWFLLGRGNHYNNRTKYFGFKEGLPEDASNLNFPAYGTEAARLLVEERGICPRYWCTVNSRTISEVCCTCFGVWKECITALENEKLEKLPEVGSWIIAMPMKIDGGSGTGRFDHPRKWYGFVYVCTEWNNLSMCFRKRMVYYTMSRNRTGVADIDTWTFNKTGTVICNAL